MQAKQTDSSAKRVSYLCLPELRERVGGEFGLNIELRKIQKAQLNALERVQHLIQMCENLCILFKNS